MYTAAGVTEIEQREIRINGVEFTAHAVPRLPIIEPERVASPPLAIALTDVYRYGWMGARRSAGRSATSSRSNRIRARRQDATLFRGRAWIAADTFAMLQGRGGADARCAGRSSSSEQVDEFRAGRAPVSGCWRDRTCGRCTKGRPTGRRFTACWRSSRSEINAGDFSARRQEAYSSAAMMLRDTPEGYRYLKRNRRPRRRRRPSIAGPIRPGRVRSPAA